jgi:hypothetical protein
VKNIQTPAPAESYLASFGLDDYAVVEGEFSAYLVGTDGRQELVYRDTNQIQRTHMNILGKRLAGTWIDGDPLPAFYIMKASVYQQPPEVISPPQVGKDAADLPAVALDPSMVMYSNAFTSTLSSVRGVVLPPSVDNEGIFLTVPPGLNTAYRHFGLFCITYLPDGSNVLSMYAYKYLSAGIAFPQGTGLRILWKIYITQ